MMSPCDCRSVIIEDILLDIKIENLTRFLREQRGFCYIKSSLFSFDIIAI